MKLYNGQRVRACDLPCFTVSELVAQTAQRLEGGARLSALFVRQPAKTRYLVVILTEPDTGTLSAACAEVGDHYPAITPEIPAAHLFEREIHERWGIVPDGHPRLLPVRYERRVGEGEQAVPLPAVTDYLTMESSEVHEVAVGPVHAGVIEPGHFRFQCHGETVLHLDIGLGYQHRGIEDALAGGPSAKTLALVGVAAGDSTIAHSLAHALVLEGLSGLCASPRAESIRGIALELERLANHMGDLGALAGDVGFLPTASYAGRLRGDFLNMTALLCGNRFGRGLVVPGGVAHDCEPARAEALLDALARTMRDAEDAVTLMFRTPSVMARFEGVGRLTAETARAIGLVGPAARATGLEVDARHDAPVGAYRFEQVPLVTWESGDVYARAQVRWVEMLRSAAFIRAQAERLVAGQLRAEPTELAPMSFVTSLVEGWRGAVLHAAFTDEQGRFESYKIVDPSFFNWTGLALAMRGGAVSDFPLCNKSFNLSYSGHDL